MSWISQFVSQFVLLAQEMSLYLFLGFLAAGLLQVFIPQRWVWSQLGGRSVAAVLKGALLGAPLPLCSCGVVPVAASLRRSGASAPATLSFLIATPVTGVDSILATYAMMGGLLAVVRPLAGVLVAILAGLALLAVSRRQEPEVRGRAGGPAAAPVRPEPLSGRLLAAARYGFGELLAGISRPLLLGLAVGAAIAVFVPPASLAQVASHRLLSYAAMVLVGTPLYVCATGSIPIAAALMEKGLSPGAALAFLLAGPATNAVTIMVAKDLIGRRGLVVYLGVILGGSIAAGWAVDVLADVLAVPSGPAASQAHLHHRGISLFQAAGGWLLLLLAAWHAAGPRVRTAVRRTLRLAGRRSHGCC